MLHVVLLWIIYNFPGYGTIGGFSHQGYAGCSWCGPKLGAEHSVELGKHIYGGTRRWLLENQKYQSAVLKEHFNW
jgi:hypothetical protein